MAWRELRTKPPHPCLLAGGTAAARHTAAQRQRHMIWVSGEFSTDWHTWNTVPQQGPSPFRRLVVSEVGSLLAGRQKRRVEVVVLRLRGDSRMGQSEFEVGGLEVQTPSLQVSLRRRLRPACSR